MFHLVVAVLLDLLMPKKTSHHPSSKFLILPQVHCALVVYLCLELVLVLECPALHLHRIVSPTLLQRLHARSHCRMTS